MTVLEQIIVDLIDSLPELYARPVIGSTPPEYGISFAYAGGNRDKYMHTAEQSGKALLSVSAKHKYQGAALSVLTQIHDALCGMDKVADAYRICDIRTASAPACAGQEESGQWVYTSSLEVDYFERSKSK